MSPANDNGLGVKMLWPGESPSGTYLGTGDTLVKRSLLVDGRLYVVGFDRWVKIGFTRDVKRRMQGLQSGLPLELRQLALFSSCERDERCMHEWFRPHRERGEWFRYEGELAEWISEGCPADVYDKATQFGWFRWACERNEALGLAA